MAVVGQLAGDEHVPAVDAGPGDGLAGLLLVAVHLRGVDVPVTGLQGGAHGLDGVLRLDQEDTEAELGDRPAVVQHDVGYRGHGGSLLGATVGSLDWVLACAPAQGGRVHPWVPVSPCDSKERGAGPPASVPA